MIAINRGKCAISPLYVPNFPPCTWGGSKPVYFKSLLVEIGWDRSDSLVACKRVDFFDLVTGERRI